MKRLNTLLQVNHGTHRGFVRLALAQLQGLAGQLDAWTAPNLANVQRLVFVCLGNINRSPFAEAMARSLGCHTVSIGLSTTAGAPATDRALMEARRYGLELGAHRATPLGEYTHAPGDLLLAMEVRHVQRLIDAGCPRGSVALLGHWSRPRRLHLHDPHKLGDAYFRTCFTLIASAVRELVDDGRACGAPFAHGAQTGHTP